MAFCGCKRRRSLAPAQAPPAGLVVAAQNAEAVAEADDMLTVTMAVESWAQGKSVSEQLCTLNDVLLLFAYPYTAPCPRLSIATHVSMDAGVRTAFRLAIQTVSAEKRMWLSPLHCHLGRLVFAKLTSALAKHAFEFPPPAVEVRTAPEHRAAAPMLLSAAPSRPSTVAGFALAKHVPAVAVRTAPEHRAAAPMPSTVASWLTCVLNPLTDEQARVAWHSINGLLGTSADIPTLDRVGLVCSMLVLLAHHAAQPSVASCPAVVTSASDVLSLFVQSKLGKDPAAAETCAAAACELLSSVVQVCNGREPSLSTP